MLWICKVVLAPFESRFAWSQASPFSELLTLCPLPLVTYKGWPKKTPQLHFEKTSIVFLHVQFLERCFLNSSPCCGLVFITALPGVPVKDEHPVACCRSPAATVPELSTDPNNTSTTGTHCTCFICLLLFIFFFLSLSLAFLWHSNVIENVHIWQKSLSEARQNFRKMLSTKCIVFCYGKHFCCAVLMMINRGLDNKTDKI